MPEDIPTLPAIAPLVVDRLSAIAELCRRLGVRRLELFGSAATGRFDPARSDLDFLVEFQPLPPDTYSRQYFDLLLALETLFERSVDLLTESSLENPYRRRRIESEKRALYVSDDIA